MQAGAVNIKLMADIADVVNKFKEIENISQKTANGMSSVFGGISNSLGGIATKVAGAFSVAAFSVWIKTAINAADVMSDISQRTGVAVKDLAGLQMAFKYGGTSAEAMQAGMVKLSVAVAGGNDALKAMGVQTKNTDGTLKSTRQILGEVADRFADYEDGAAKTALAVQVFGKSGAELLPVLNAGSKGLDEFDAMARKLGLTIDSETAEQAGRFNDLLDLMGDSFSGIATQVGAKILPTLVKLADSFFTTMTEGDRLTRIAQALAFGLKALYSVGVLVIEAFVSVGKTLGAAGAQIMAVMQGDFAGAARIGNEWAADVKKDWVGALKNLEGVWSETGKTSVDSMLDMAGAVKKNAPIVNEETKKMAEEQSKLQEAYKKLIDSIDEKIAVAEAELEQGKKLTPAQQMEVKLLADISAGTVKLNDQQLTNVNTRIKALRAVEDLNEELKLEKKILEDASKENASWSDSMGKSTQGLIQEAEKQREANDAISLGKDAVEQMRIAKLREMAVSADKKAQWAEEAMLSEEVVNAYRDQSKALRDLADLKEQGIHVQAAKDAADAWSKTTDQIQTSLTDALMRGFESGKDFGKNLADTLINMFKTLVLRPIIQPIAQGASSVVLSLMGMGASGSASAGGLSSAVTLGGASMAAIGESIATGFMTTIGGGSVSAAASAYGAAGMSGVSTGLSVGAGAAAAIPYVAAALIAANALGLMRSTKTVGGGLTGTLGAGDISAYDLQRESGTLFAGPDYTVANTRIADVSEYLQSSFLTMRESAAKMAQVLGKSSEEVAAFTMAVGDVQVHPDIDKLGLVLDGLTEQEKAAKIEAVFTAANEAMAKLVLGAADLQHAGETAYEALTRLVNIQLVSNALNEFGGAFATFANASIGARESVISLVGGIDQLMTKAQGFVTNFYTAEEQAGITARGVVTALDQAGFTAAQIAALETRADFRSLLESIDMSATNGEEQFAALLNVQEQFASLSGIMETQQMSLLELIEAGPQVEILQKMFESDAEYGARTATAEELAQTSYDAMVSSLVEINISVGNLSTVMASGLDSIANATAGAISTANAAAAQAIAAAQASAFTAAQAKEAAAIAARSVIWDGTAAATGGYISGPTLVGEYGPEIFDPRTSQVHTNAATMSMLGGGDVAIEVRALREEVSMLRYEARATATHTAKIAKLQDNWDVRGLTVKTDADQPLDTVTV